MSRAAAAALLLAVTVTACSGDRQAATPASTAVDADRLASASLGRVPLFSGPPSIDGQVVADVLLEPLALLPSCGPDGVGGSVTVVDSPDEAPLPPGTSVASVVADAGLITITGVIATTPVEIRLWYQLLDGWEVVQVEDEGRESETLIDRDGVRLFVKAQAVCASGSQFVAVLADAG